MGWGGQTYDGKTDKGPSELFKVNRFKLRGQSDVKGQHDLKGQLSKHRASEEKKGKKEERNSY